jgi:hypothetical protein
MPHVFNSASFFYRRDMLDIFFQLFFFFFSFFRLFIHPRSKPRYLFTFLSRNGGVKLQKDGSEMAAENTEKENGGRSGDNFVASKKDV